MHGLLIFLGCNCSSELRIAPGSIVSKKLRAKQMARLIYELQPSPRLSDPVWNKYCFSFMGGKEEHGNSGYIDQVRPYGQAEWVSSSSEYISRNFKVLTLQTSLYPHHWSYCVLWISHSHLSIEKLSMETAVLLALGTGNISSQYLSIMVHQWLLKNWSHQVGESGYSRPGDLEAIRNSAQL